MKKILLILALVSALCLVFASCDKDTGNDDGKGQHISTGTNVKVTFTAKGVNGQSDEVTNVDLSIVKYAIVDQKLEAPDEPTKDGYVFEGWFMGDIEWDFDEMVVAEEMTLTAEWSAEVKYELGSGINSENNPSKIYTNATYPITLASPTRDGYAFEGWYTDAEFVNKVTALDVCKSYTLYANWTEGTMVDYTVKVQSEGGLPLKDVWVYIHKGVGNNEIAYAVTDSNGIATFSLLTPSDYSVQLDSAPNGYIVSKGLTKDDRYPLTAPETVIKLTSAPTAEPKSGVYKVGDVIHDFEITDIDGVTYKLSDMLKTKELIVLNYWFINCGWCKIEFPEINSAYNKYKDKVAVFGMNNSSDSKEAIKQYGETNNLDFPLVKIRQDGLNLANFGSNSCPTTVMIDRYGVIVSIHSGAVCESVYGISEPWNKIFVAYIGDNYQQKLLTDIAGFLGKK